MASQGAFDRRAFLSARLAAGLTQHELARQLGVAGGERVSRWELGLSVPRTATLKRAADLLAVDPSRLLGEAEPPTLSTLRRSCGLTLADLAREVHVSKATVSRWESGLGTKSLPQSTLLHLAQVLGTSPAVIAEAVERRRA